MIKIVALCIFSVFCVSSCYENVLAARPRDCGGLIVVDDTVVIDGPFHENCLWQFQSQQEDRILAFSVIGGNINEAKDFIVIHDGFGVDSPIVESDNQRTHESSRDNLPATLYTTLSKATVRFLKAPPLNFQLKIQKAVDCPFNLGIDTQCGRVVDALSCYCALFTNRNQTDQTMICIDNKMKLLSLESLEEEVFINAAWGTTTRFFTSLTDFRREGYWIWESTMTYPTYYNWGPGEPNNTVTDEDCMFFAGVLWVDVACSYLAHAICEAQP